jgi:hypothetical protein
MKAPEQAWPRQLARQQEISFDDFSAAAAADPCHFIARVHYGRAAARVPALRKLNTRAVIFIDVSSPEQNQAS